MAKKSRVFWIDRSCYENGSVYLYNMNQQLVTYFCQNRFRRVFPIGLYPGQKKKVKITIEVIE